MSGRVSIVIPVYGVEKHIGYCIESIISQMFTDFEAILVDDDREKFKRYLIRNFGLEPDGNFMLDLFPYSSKEPLES